LTSKPKIAIHSITGCAGCQLTIYFIKDLLLDVLGAIDLVAAPMIKGKNSEGPYDICFVEGLVASQDDLELVKKWREQSKILVAWGTCATHGNVPGIKNFMQTEKVERAQYDNTSHLKGRISVVKPTPIEAHVKVDFNISGCPPEETEFLKFVKEALMGMNPRIYNEPVCVECTKREIKCILEDGEECLGPLIRGGCNALCPGVKHGCTGCHGPIPQSNIPQTIELLKENGINSELIIKRLRKYAGLKFEELGVK
jgi:coenzyme F420-reducing hydrogenase gamma subunit